MHSDNLEVFLGWIIMASNKICIEAPSPHIHTNKATVASSHAFRSADNSHTLLAARCFWLFSQIAGIMRDFLLFFWCFVFLALWKLWLAIHYHYKLRSTEVSSREKEATRCCYRKPECNVGETNYFSLVSHELHIVSTSALLYFFFLCPTFHYASTVRWCGCYSWPGLKLMHGCQLSHLEADSPSFMQCVNMAVGAALKVLELSYLFKELYFLKQLLL